jgi:two-component system, OmpR family, KDP operon response regulator KdpE
MSAERSATALVVDDEPQIRRFLKAGLSAHGYGVVEAPTGEAALRLATTTRPDIVVLDLGLPDMEGFQVVSSLREWSQVPILVLTVRGREIDKVRALDGGVDDYVTKPFGMAELLARIGALLRRARPAGAPVAFTSGGLEVDLERRLVRVDGVERRLSRKQYDLLRLLVLDAGKVVTQQHLLRELWGPANSEDVQYLRIFMRKLRLAIEPDPTRPRYLVTELGVGYRLRTHDQLPEPV